MDVKVPDRLSGVLSLVDHQPVTRFRHAFLFGDFLRRVQKVEVVARLRQIGDAPHLFSGHNQDVDGGLRVDVPKRHHVIVFEHDVRRDFTVDDAGEERRHDP